MRAFEDRITSGAALETKAGIVELNIPFAHFDNYIGGDGRHD
jgi:hypothetical protein